MTATVSAFRTLSPTAREVDFILPAPLNFFAGAFINIFVEKNGEKLRRAYSISSSDVEQQKVSVAIRKMPGGAVGPLFWNDDILGTTLDIMGPLGLNTVDKIVSPRVFLFGFGIGAGVIQSIALSLLEKKDIEHVHIMTGSKTDDEVIFEGVFTELAQTDPRISFTAVISNPSETSTYPAGYIQNHIDTLDFNNADIYICGQEVACSALRIVIEAKKPQDVHFFIEAFH